MCQAERFVLPESRRAYDGIFDRLRRWSYSAVDVKRYIENY